MKNNLEPVSIQAKTIPESWFNCLAWLINHKDGGTGIHTYTIDSGSYVGQKRLELDYVTGHITYPGSLPLVPDVPVGIPNPSSDEYIQRYILKLMTSQKDGKPGIQFRELYRSDGWKVDKGA